MHGRGEEEGIKRGDDTDSSRRLNAENRLSEDSSEVRADFTTT